MIKRVLFDELKAHILKKEISFIVGPRQAGKTTLMLLLKEHLEKSNEKVVFFNLDIEADKQFFGSQADFIGKIKLEIGGQRGFVFIDEVQRKQDAGVFLKGLYDMNLPYKFIVSGSGSMELKEKIHESLLGRKRVFELSTVTFHEFVDFKTGYRYQGRLLDFFSVDKEKTRALLEEYMNFGGYPSVVLEEQLTEKQKAIDEIYQSYIEKDISYLLKIRKTEDFSNLVKLMSAQAGSLVNFSELSSTLGISQKTVKDYLWYIEKTFILKKVTPYFTNARKEITKSPVFYFYDIGLKNYASGAFGSILGLKEAAFSFQNLIFNILKEHFSASPAKIHFWRTKDKAEVDFVIDTGRDVVPLEVKYKEFKEPEITRPLRNFIEKYQPQKALVVNLCLKKTLQIGKTKVVFIPFYEVIEALEYKGGTEHG